MFRDCLRDLVTIVTKCLQKEPSRRYATAAEMADDVERFLDDRPILARRTSTLEHGWRWCRRNPVLAALIGSVAGLLVAVAAVSFLSAIRLNHQLVATQNAQRSEQDARKLAEVRLWESYLGEIRAGYGSRQIGQRIRSLTSVDRANKLLDEIGRTSHRVFELRNATIAVLAAPGLREERVVSQEHAISAALSVTADRFAAIWVGGKLAVHRLSSGELVSSIPQVATESDNLNWVDISADGRFVAVKSDRGVKICAATAIPPNSCGSGRELPV